VIGPDAKELNLAADFFGPLPIVVGKEWKILARLVGLVGLQGFRARGRAVELTFVMVNAPIASCVTVIRGCLRQTGSHFSCSQGSGVVPGVVRIEGNGERQGDMVKT